MVNKQKPTGKVTTKDDILRAFNHFRRSRSWAADLLNVSRAAITRWLNGSMPSSELDQQMPKLAQMLIDTDGTCVRGEVDGPSVRQMLARKRGARKP